MWNTLHRKNRAIRLDLFLREFFFLSGVRYLFGVSSILSELGMLITYSKGQNFLSLIVLKLVCFCFCFYLTPFLLCKPI